MIFYPTLKVHRRPSCLGGLQKQRGFREGSQALMFPPYSPYRCGWSWPRSWVSGYLCGSWARASTISTTCSEPIGVTGHGRGTNTGTAVFTLCLPCPWRGDAGEH